MHCIIWKYKFDFKFIEKTAKTNLVLLFFPLSVFNNLFFKFHRDWIFAFTNLPAFTVEARKTLYLMHSLLYLKANRLILLFIRCLEVHNIQHKSRSVDCKWNHGVLTHTTMCFALRHLMYMCNSVHSIIHFSLDLLTTLTKASFALKGTRWDAQEQGWVNKVFSRFLYKCNHNTIKDLIGYCYGLLLRLLLGRREKIESKTTVT